MRHTYEKITGYTPRFDYFTATFEGTNLFSFAGASAFYNGGFLIRVW